MEFCLILDKFRKKYGGHPAIRLGDLSEVIGELVFFCQGRAPRLVPGLFFFRDANEILERELNDDD